MILRTFLSVLFFTFSCEAAAFVNGDEGGGIALPVVATQRSVYIPDDLITLTFYERGGIDINISEWHGGKFNIIGSRDQETHLLTSGNDEDVVLIMRDTPMGQERETSVVLFMCARLRYRCLCASDLESNMVVSINDGFIYPTETINCVEETYDDVVDDQLIRAAQNMATYYR